MTTTTPAAVERLEQMREIIERAYRDCECVSRPWEVLDAAWEAVAALTPPAAPEIPAGITGDQIKHMVNRFLAWKLPSDFSPDNGIIFDRVVNLGTEHQHCREPVGTNLFTATQAEAMIRYLVEDFPSAAPETPTGMKATLPPGSCSSEYLAGWGDGQADLLGTPTARPAATAADMASFGASHAACYHCPGEGQQAERTAFCAGAAYGARPAATAGEVERLIAELRERAVTASKVLRQMAEAKSLRQTDNPEGRTDIYMWQTPEQTVEGRAATMLAALASDRAEIERLREALVDHNDALRSACQIANRDGKDTNWLSFRGTVHYTLAEHHETTNAARAALGEKRP